ncbi:GWxTD domain-containing protein [candidate division KSB1 bacterium]|nr:GWxTD domain-containing protein [candidate division KSB1 bacterium]
MIPRKILLLFCFTSFFAAILSAQTVAPKAPLILNVDYSRYYYDDQTGYLEVYFGFLPKQLTYNFMNGKYEAGIKLATKIRGKDSKEYIVNERTLLAISEKDTSDVWYDFPFTTQNGYVIPNGNYVLEILAIDSLDNSRRDSLDMELNISNFGTELSISDLELCKSIKSSQDKELLFYKNSLEVLPHPSLIFGASTAPVVFYYIEIYNINPNIKYLIKTDILDDFGKSVRQMSKERQFKSKSSLEVSTTPVSTFESGKYSLRFSLYDDKQNQLVSTEKTFFIYNPHIQFKQLASISVKGAFRNMSDDELDNEFEYSRYFATDEEKEVFSKLDVIEAKRKFLFKLWQNVVNGRGDLPPISRSGYLIRREIADQKYHSFGKKGWESDQGRVFMLYSEPDEIDRTPQESIANRYEIWRYFNLEKGVEFVFVDRWGYGNLGLVHSTKRGEFQDILWEKFLK